MQHIDVPSLLVSAGLSREWGRSGECEAAPTAPAPAECVCVCVWVLFLWGKCECEQKHEENEA